MPIFTKAGIADDMDGGCVDLRADSPATFVSKLGKLRFWDREPNVHAV